MVTASLVGDSGVPLPWLGWRVPPVVSGESWLWARECTQSAQTLSSSGSVHPPCLCRLSRMTVSRCSSSGRGMASWCSSASRPARGWWWTAAVPGDRLCGRGARTLPGPLQSKGACLVASISSPQPKGARTVASPSSPQSKGARSVASPSSPQSKGADTGASASSLQSKGADTGASASSPQSKGGRAVRLSHRATALDRTSSPFLASLRFVADSPRAVAGMESALGRPCPTRAIDSNRAILPVARAPRTASAPNAPTG